MSHRHHLWMSCFLLVLALRAAHATDAAMPDALERARAAANAGDAATALVLYDALLRDSPGDVVALNESARQLSWSGRYAEALDRYDRVLAIDPQNRFARLERAKVLSWSGRYAEAADAFRTLLSTDESDLDARLGLARSLSWSGNQPAARREFQQVLSQHPDNADALLGLARTYAWSNQMDEARRLYGDAARAMPDPKDAEVGMAYLDLWEGDVASAWTTATRLAASHPGDREVADLERAIRRATLPWFAVGWDQMDDTDRNLLTTTRTEMYSRLPNGIGLGLGYNDYDVRTAGERGSIDSLQARADWSLRHGHRLEAMLGVDRLERPGQPGHFVSDWGLAWRFPLAGSWNGWLSARREPYRYSVPLIDNRIVIDSLAAGVNGTAGEGWLLGTEVTGWELSDGNSRLAADAHARHRWQMERQTFEAGAVARWLDWKDDLDSGYFDPSGFTSFGATARAYGPLSGSRSLDYDISVETGLQSFDYAGQSTRGDPYYLAVARLGLQASDTVRVEIFAEAGSYASEGSEDWRYTRAGARIVWQPGASRK